MKRQLPFILVAICAAAFVFGVFQLFRLRFEAGDVYPPYSSLRSDPLGTMALYESLEKLPGISVRRDYSVNNQLPDGKETAYLHLAGSPYDWHWLPEEAFKEIEQFVTSGGRLAIAMYPVSSRDHSYRHWDDDDETNSPPAKINKKESKKTKPEGKKAEEEKPKDEKMSQPEKAKKHPKRSSEEGRLMKWLSLNERWGVDFELVNLEQGEDTYEPATVSNQSALPLPDTLEWHSGIVLTNLNPAWKTIYSRGTHPVLVERKFGRGTVVIATDSFFLSNEALEKDRHADLLSWIIGGSRNVFFDEAHLGVAERPGVAGLMRKYRLHWLAAGLILLAALFIWKNSSSLVPIQDSGKREEFIAGKDAASGFVNLLRRSIPAGDLMTTCFAEWKKSIAGSGKYSAARVQQAETIFQVENSLLPKDRNPLRAYRQIHEALESRKSHLTPDTSNLAPENEHRTT
jgi:hypothetical protein